MAAPAEPDDIVRVFWWRYSGGASEEKVARHTRSMQRYSEEFISRQTILAYKKHFVPGDHCPDRLRAWLNALPFGTTVHFHVRRADGLVNKAETLLRWYAEFSHLKLVFRHFQYLPGGCLTLYAVNYTTFFTRDSSINEYPPLCFGHIYTRSLSQPINAQVWIFCKYIDDLGVGRALPFAEQERNTNRNRMPPGWEALVG